MLSADPDAPARASGDLTSPSLLLEPKRSAGTVPAGESVSTLDCRERAAQPLPSVVPRIERSTKLGVELECTATRATGSAEAKLTQPCRVRTGGSA